MKQFLAHLIFTILVIAITLCFADEIDSYTIPPVYALPDKVVQYDPEPVTATMLATAYDLSIHCCGKPYGHPSRGITADGTDINRLSRDEAMVVATNDLPLGTRVELTFEGNSYGEVAEHYGLKRGDNVYQILKRAGMLPEGKKRGRRGRI